MDTNNPQRDGANEPEPAGLSQEKALLAASTGGHLAQLDLLSNRLQVSSESLWITFDHAQSQSILAGRRSLFVPYIPPRGWKELIRAIPRIWRHLTAESFDVAISTGAAIALVVLPLSRASGARSIYIESVSRLDGPSLTGRVLALLPGIETYSQHQGYPKRRWRTIDPVLSEFVAVEDQKSLQNTDGRRRRIFVTLGTIKPYRFDSLVDAVLASVGPEDSLVWQTGCTNRNDLPGQVTGTIDSSKFIEEVTASDIVVTHAGVGSILEILRLGKFPVVVPRRKSRNEHVDDHQAQIGLHLAKLGVARYVESQDMTNEDLVDAMRYRILQVERTA